MSSLSAAEIQQQLAFEGALRVGQRVLATAPIEEGGTLRFTATIARLFPDAVVVVALEPFRLLEEAPGELTIPRFSAPGWSPSHRLEPLPQNA